MIGWLGVGTRCSSLDFYLSSTLFYKIDMFICFDGAFKYIEFKELDTVFPQYKWGAEAYTPLWNGIPSLKLDTELLEKNTQVQYC